MSVRWRASPRTAIPGLDYDTDYGVGEPSYMDGAGGFPAGSNRTAPEGVLEWGEGEQGTKVVRVSVLRLGAWRVRDATFSVELAGADAHPTKQRVSVTLAGCAEQFAAGRRAMKGFNSSNASAAAGSCRSEWEAKCGDGARTQVSGGAASRRTGRCGGCLLGVGGEVWVWIKERRDMMDESEKREKREERTGMRGLLCP